MKRLWILIGMCVGVSVQARDWTEDDLVQDVTLTCELLLREGTTQNRLARAVGSGQTPRFRAALGAEARFQSVDYRGKLRMIDEGAYLELSDAEGHVLQELIRPEFFANDDIWINHELESGQSIRWLCSYRAAQGKDLSVLRDLYSMLQLLVRGLDDINSGSRTLSVSSPATVAEACYRVGIALMRAQRLADRSSPLASGWRARRTTTDLRDRIAMEGVNLCRTAASMDDVRNALDRIYLQVAAVRDAVSPDTHARLE
jgi:hypothetical protein